MTGNPFARGLESALIGLHVPMDDMVIFGSAVMKLHGLKDEIGDIDLFVSQRAYYRMRQSERWWEQRPAPHDPPLLEGMGTVEGRVYAFHAFHAWTSRDAWLDVPEAMATAERVSGLLCIGLDLVAAYKARALKWCADNNVTIGGSPWEKHVADLRRLQDAGVEVAL